MTFCQWEVCFCWTLRIAWLITHVMLCVFHCLMTEPAVVRQHHWSVEMNVFDGCLDGFDDIVLFVKQVCVLWKFNINIKTSSPLNLNLDRSDNLNVTAETLSKKACALAAYRRNWRECEGNGSLIVVCGGSYGTLKLVLCYLLARYPTHVHVASGIFSNWRWLLVYPFPTRRGCTECKYLQGLWAYGWLNWVRWAAHAGSSSRTDERICHSFPRQVSRQAAQGQTHSTPRVSPDGWEQEIQFTVFICERHLAWFGPRLQSRRKSILFWGDLDSYWKSG